MAWLGLAFGNVLLLHIFLYCFLWVFSKETDFIVRAEPYMSNPTQCIPRHWYYSVGLECFCIRYTGYRKYMDHLSPGDLIVINKFLLYWDVYKNSHCLVIHMWKLKKMWHFRNCASLKNRSSKGNKWFQYASKADNHGSRSIPSQVFWIRQSSCFKDNAHQHVNI